MSAPLSADLAQIGKSVVIKGDLSGSEDLYVDGQVEGTISLKNNSLTVGPHGQVKASVEAKGVVVQGKLEGKYPGQRPGRTAQIRRHDGRYFNAEDCHRGGRLPERQSGYSRQSRQGCRKVTSFSRSTLKSRFQRSIQVPEYRLASDSK